ncbi:hypothetical protein PIB30_010080 [Stylosanthes scabra]|uniref:Exocyst subunit Exo70 family protein n=1 Tax=Stylosanthes scabra TaxID=79078 RepID=A0ABU6X484_9FABA|nr:hypothetical protein [Stylosanthes scabra]
MVALVVLERLKALVSGYLLNMTPLSVQIPRWLMHPKLWRFLGFASSIVGLLCYALSTPFNFLFGKWNLVKISIYIVFSFIICIATFFTKIWQHSASLRLKAHMAFLVLTITSVYSFFFDKAVNGKPDAYSVVSCAAFAIMLFSLSRQIHCGFEVDLLYFFLGVFIVQLMKIKLLLGIVGVCFSYFLIILRSSLNLVLEDEYFEHSDQNQVVTIQVDSQQSNDGSSLTMQRLSAYIERQQRRDYAIIHNIFYQASRYGESIDGPGKVIDPNLVADALGQIAIKDLQDVANSAMAAGKLQESMVRDVHIEIVEASKEYRILFPSERQICNRVFPGHSAANACFAQICSEATIQLLKFAEAFVTFSLSSNQMIQTFHVFHALNQMIPNIQTLFSDDPSLFLVNEAVTTLNKLRETVTDMKKLIFCSKEAMLVLPNGGVHLVTYNVMTYILFIWQSQKKLQLVSLEYQMDTGARSSLFANITLLLQLLERKLRTNSKKYKDPALGYFFMMNNRSYIENRVKEWELGTFVGDHWAQNNTAKFKQNLELYYRSSWNKLLNYLNLDYSSESLAPDVATESMKNKLLLFNSHFMKTCIVQSTWSVFDEQLREEIRTSIKNMLLPAYGNFIGKIRKFLGMNAYEYIKYRMPDIEARI